MDDSRKMNVTSESDESATNTNSTNSPAVEDALNDEENEKQDDKTPLKKGPWTASEDAILVEYIKKHGEGNWNAVQKNTELARCGKSCRLRWTNHLKPDLKKGAFSPEEEKLVVELHLQMGNKWARMASALPGRTDNEIKNFWNTRLKRRKRDGLDPYPSDLRVETLNGNGPNGPMGPLSSIEGNNPCSATVMKMNEKDKFPPTEFKVFDLVEYLVTVPDFPSSTSTPQDLRSFYANKGYYCQFTPTPSENLLHGSGPVLVNSCVFSPHVLQIRNDGYSQIQENNLMCPPLQNDNITIINSISNNAYEDSYLNRVITSPPELPSLQTQSGTWDSILCPSSLPSLESYDSFVQTLSIEDQIVPAQNSGLLDAVIHESSQVNSGLSGQVLHGSPQAMNNNKEDRPLQGSNIAVHTNDNSIRNLKEVEPNIHIPQPILSPPSIFSQGTPISSDSSLDALDLMCSNSGDELIFPEISIDGLEMNYDDGDDIFSGLDLLPEPGHDGPRHLLPEPGDDVPRQSTHQEDLTIRGN